MRTACGLDIGSNTFSFVELKRSASMVEIVQDCSLAVRLSEGLVPGGPLKPAAVNRGLDALKRLVRDYRFLDKPLIAVATESLRKADDPEVFLGPAREIIQSDIRVVSPEEEARLTAIGATIGLFEQGPWAVIDIGGQSTEISWTDTAAKWHVRCLQMGVVDLTERFLHGDPPSPEEMTAMATKVRQTLRSTVPSTLDGPLIAVAGTATSLAMLILGLTNWERDKVHALQIPRQDMQRWHHRILSLTTQDRIQLLGIRPVRADVFPAGICILEETVSHLGLETFTVSANGLRVGAALSIL